MISYRVAYSISAGRGGDSNYLDGDRGNGTLKGDGCRVRKYAGSERELMIRYYGADLMNDGDGKILYAAAKAMTTGTATVMTVTTTSSLADQKRLAQVPWNTSKFALMRPESYSESRSVNIGTARPRSRLPPISPCLDFR